MFLESVCLKNNSIQSRLKNISQKGWDYLVTKSAEGGFFWGWARCPSLWSKPTPAQENGNGC